MTEPHAAPLSPLAGLVTRLRKRAEAPPVSAPPWVARGGGAPPPRETDPLVKQTVDALVHQWPDIDPAGGARLALGAFACASHSADRSGAGGSRLHDVLGEIAASRLIAALRAVREDDTSLAQPMMDTWRRANGARRDLLATIIVDCANGGTLDALASMVQAELMKLQADVSGLLHRMYDGTGISPATAARDSAVLLARIRVRRGMGAIAIDMLERDQGSDPRALEAISEFLADAGRIDEAIDRLRKALIVGDKARIREKLAEILLKKGDTPGAVEELLQLLRESGDITWWHLLNEHLGDSSPEQLEGIRQDLRQRSPTLYIDILIADGNTQGVVDASASKTFSFEILWRIGDYLAEIRPDEAARIYERAITLEGAVAHSRVQAVNFASRLESVMPFFARIERPTKVLRLVKEILSRNKGNVPLRRELDRVFGKGL